MAGVMNNGHAPGSFGFNFSDMFIHIMNRFKEDPSYLIIFKFRENFEINATPDQIDS